MPPLTLFQNFASQFMSEVQRSMGYTNDPLEGAIKVLVEELTKRIATGMMSAAIRADDELMRLPEIQEALQKMVLVEDAKRRLEKP